MKKNKLLKLLIFNISLLAITTYAWFASFYAVENIEGDFFFELNITITESTENIETLEKSLPMSVNDAIEQITPHEFTISTTGSDDINYYIIVNDITDEELFGIDASNVYYAVNLNGSTAYSVGTLQEATSKRELVYQSILPGNSSVDISIRLWLGPGAVVDGAASVRDPDTLVRTYRYFKAQVVVEAD